MINNNLFDESKIIKKEDRQNKSSEVTTKPEEAYMPDFNAPPLSINQKTIESVIEKKPVFVYEKNSHTKQVQTNNTVQIETINIDIPLDQVKLIYVNTKKYINELELEIQILESLLKNKDEQFVFYKSKLEYNKNEYVFCKNKESILEKIIRGV